jgi:hypothetical protein
VGSDLSALESTPSKEQNETRVSYHTEAIHEALVELSNVSVAIRNSSRAAETVQARALLCEQLEMSRYEILCQIALESLYPSAPEALIIQLRESMVNRYARHLYRAPMHEALEEDVRVQRTGQPDFRTPATEQYYENRETPSERLFQVPVSQRKTEMVPPTINSSQFSSNLRAVRDPVLPSPTLVKLSRIYGPPVPTFNETGQAQCAWCFQTINQMMVKKGQWTEQGM